MSPVRDLAASRRRRRPARARAPGAGTAVRVRARLAGRRRAGGNARGAARRGCGLRRRAVGRVWARAVPERVPRTAFSPAAPAWSLAVAPSKQRAEISSKRTDACGETSTSKRPASFATQASSSGTGGTTARRSRCSRPSTLSSVPSRSSAAVAGRTRSAQPPASPWNIVTAITASARSASARTLGEAAASSPTTRSRPIGSGSDSSSSAAAAQAVATPRPFGVAARWKAPQPGFSSKPSECAASATRAPPPPPGPHQMRMARSAARSFFPSELPGSVRSWSAAAAPPGGVSPAAPVGP